MAETYRGTRKVGDTTPKTVEQAAKNPIYNFVGLSLESGEKVDLKGKNGISCGPMPPPFHKWLPVL